MWTIWTLLSAVRERPLNLITHSLTHSWWRHQMETFSALLAFCAGNSPVPGEFPAQRPVTRSFDVVFDLRLNKLLSKQSWGWWVETPWCPLWRHCNVKVPFSKVRICYPGNTFKMADEIPWNLTAFGVLNTCDVLLLWWKFESRKIVALQLFIWQFMNKLITICWCCFIFSVNGINVDFTHRRVSARKM